MSDSKYKNLLHGEFESLGYFADEYYAAPGRYERFELLIKKIWPCIQKLSLFSAWTKQASAIKREYSQIQAMLKGESTKTFKSLKEKITNENRLLEDSSINEMITNIEKIIELRDQADQAYDLIKNLISYLFDHGEIEVVKEYIKIFFVKKHRYYDDPAIVEIYEKPEIHSFTFAPSVETSFKLGKDLFGCKIKNIWAVLFFFERADSSWDSSLDIIRAKYYKNGDLNEFIFKRGDWEEINIIKNDPQMQTYYFTTKNADKCLKFILYEIILSKINSQKQEVPEDLVRRLSIKLYAMYLLLDIEYALMEKKETRILGKFQSTKSENYKIAKAICDAKFVSSIEPDKDTSRFLIDCGLNGILGNLILPLGDCRDTKKIWKSYPSVVISNSNKIASDAGNDRVVSLSTDDIIEMSDEINNLELWPH